MEQKIKKNFVVFYISAFELVTGNSHYYEKNTCYRETEC